MSYSERLDEAMTFAHQLHRAQRRKGSGVPYITHLLGVASLVGDHGGDEDQVIAALLHDAIEDQASQHPALDAQISARFGPSVLRMVLACTDAQEHPKPPWRARKEAYLRHLRALDHDDPALLVSAADKLYNARTIARDQRLMGDAVFERFVAGKQDTLWYYEALVEAFEAAHSAPAPTRALVAELRQVVAALRAAPPQPTTR